MLYQCSELIDMTEQLSYDASTFASGFATLFYELHVLEAARVQQMQLVVRVLHNNCAVNLQLLSVMLFVMSAAAGILAQP